MRNLNLFRIISFSLGTIFLILSYLCFLNIIQHPSLAVCGSMCEFWWSWLIDFPPQGPCIEICIMRNVLYKPFFIIGIILILSEVLIEIIYRFKHKTERES